MTIGNKLRSIGTVLGVGALALTSGCAERQVENIIGEYDFNGDGTPDYIVARVFPDSSELEQIGIIDGRNMSGWSAKDVNGSLSGYNLRSSSPFLPIDGIPLQPRTTPGTRMIAHVEGAKDKGILTDGFSLDLFTVFDMEPTYKHEHFENARVPKF